MPPVILVIQLFNFIIDSIVHISSILSYAYCTKVVTCVGVNHLDFLELIKIQTTKSQLCLSTRKSVF